MGRAADRPTLSGVARAFRLAHSMIAVVDVAALAYVWFCGLRRRRDRLLGVSVGALLTEGVALAIGRGNCPLGPLQRRLGDEVPLFELVLPPKAAKAAVPVLTVVSLIGIGIALTRTPSEDDPTQPDAVDIGRPREMAG
jgi:hypothetical protein